MKKLLAALLLAFSFSFATPALASQCAPGTSFEEVWAKHQKENQKVWLFTEDAMRKLEAKAGVEPDTITGVMIVPMATGDGVVVYIGWKGCIYAETMGVMAWGDFETWIGGLGLSRNDVNYTIEV